MSSLLTLLINGCSLEPLTTIKDAVAEEATCVCPNCDAGKETREVNVAYLRILKCGDGSLATETDDGKRSNSLSGLIGSCNRWKL